MVDSSMSTEDINTKCRVRNHWTVPEDEKLYELVRQHGPHNWNSIAENLEGRTGKSCRLRWVNHLDPKVYKRPFTKMEEERLLAAQMTHGNSWAIIAKLFSGRTANDVKNHWHVAKRKQKKESEKTSSQEFNNDVPHQNTTVENPHDLNPTGKEVSDANAALDHSRSQKSAVDGRMKRNFMDMLGNSSSTFAELRAASSSEKERVVEESNEGGQKKIRFFDFLGVGADDQ